MNKEQLGEMYGTYILNMFLSRLKLGVCTLTKTEFNRDFDQVSVMSLDDPRYYIKLLVGKPVEGGHHCEQCEKDSCNCISEVEETDFNEENS